MKTSLPPVLSGTADGGGLDGWIDGGEIEEERRGRRRGGGVIQEESATVGLIRDQSFVSGLIFSSEVVSWPSLCSRRRSVGLSVARRQIPPFIQEWATLINFVREIMASSEESARRGKTLRETFFPRPGWRRQPPPPPLLHAPPAVGVIYFVLLSRLCPKNEI